MIINGRRPSSLKHENCMNNKIALQEGNKANGVGVGVGAGGRRKGEGEPREDDAVGKAMELRRKAWLCRETYVGPSRAIYFPRSLTAFALVGNRFVTRRHTSPTFLRNDLLHRYLFMSREKLINGSTGTRECAL